MWSLPLVVLTAYLFVWMGRRSVGVVCLVSAWIAGAISVHTNRIILDCYAGFMLLSFCPYVGTWRFLWWCILILWHVYLEVYNFISVATVENYICMPTFVICWWRDVYFLNKCFIRVYYRFNRNRALHISQDHSWYGTMIVPRPILYTRISIFYFFLLFLSKLLHKDLRGSSVKSQFL